MDRTHGPERPARWGGALAVLQHRNFRLLWLSLLISNSGTWLQQVAQDYLVYQLTGRALELGLVNVVRAVALIGLSFLGGTIADRVDRRRLLMATQTAFALLAAGLGLLVQVGAVQVWHVVAASFAGAVILAVDQPARQALIPHLVPREQLLNAVALNSVTFTGAAAIGPALAGPLVALLGLTWGFYLNALSYGAVIYAVWAMRLPPTARGHRAGGVGQAVVDGLRYVARSPAILLLVSLLTVVSFFVTPYQSVLPLFSHRVFGGDVGVLGLLRAAPGLGALVGGVVLASQSRVGNRARLALAGALGFCLTTFTFAFTRWLPGALALLFASGVLSTVFQSTVQTLMQYLTPDALRGRVMSLFAVCVIGTWPLGALPLSWEADLFGAPAATAANAVIAGLYCLATAALARRTLAALDRAGGATAG